MNSFQLFALLLLSVAALRQSEYDSINADLADLFSTHKRDITGAWLPATVVRLGFHDAGTWSSTAKDGGPHAVQFFNCISPTQKVCEQNNNDNDGLSWVIDALETVYKNYADKLSRADFWALSANQAIKFTGGPDIPFRWGRTDLTAEWSRLTRLPKSTGDLSHVRSTMGPGRLDLTDRQIVALMGAHTLGEGHPDTSGHKGPWDDTPTVFDNHYFQSLLLHDWVFDKNNNGQFVATRNGKKFLMLRTDMALRSDLSNLARDSPLKVFITEYAGNQEKFFQDFVTAWVKVQEAGAATKGSPSIPHVLHNLCDEVEACPFTRVDLKTIPKPAFDAAGLSSYYHVTPKPPVPGAPGPVGRFNPTPKPTPKPTPTPHPTPTPTPKPHPTPTPTPIPKPTPPPTPTPTPSRSTGDFRVTTTGSFSTGFGTGSGSTIHGTGSGSTIHGTGSGGTSQGTAGSTSQGTAASTSQGTAGSTSQGTAGSTGDLSTSVSTGGASTSSIGTGDSTSVSTGGDSTSSIGTAGTTGDFSTSSVSTGGASTSSTGDISTSSLSTTGASFSTDTTGSFSTSTGDSSSSTGDFIPIPIGPLTAGPPPFVAPPTIDLPVELPVEIPPELQNLRQEDTTEESDSAQKPWIWGVVAVGVVALIAVVVLSVLIVKYRSKSAMETV